MTKFFALQKWKHLDAEAVNGLSGSDTAEAAEAACRASAEQFNDFTFSRVVQANGFNEAQAMCKGRKS